MIFHIKNVGSAYYACHPSLDSKVAQVISKSLFWDNSNKIFLEKHKLLLV